MSSLADPATAARPRKIEFDDPHAQVGPAEAETTRVRTLTGVWRWLLILATAATIFLCINQQFTLRFFIGYTQLNTEYFYLLIACMLPFTFLIFPASSSAPLDRVPWYDVALFLATLAAAAYLMASVRKAAELGWEFAGAPMPVIVAGFVLWVLLMEGLRRTGGWSLLLSVLPFTVYPLFADQRWLGPLRGQQSTARAGHRLSHAVQRERARHPDPGVRRHRDRLPGVRHRADDDGCRQVLHQPRLRPVRHVPRRRRQGRHLRQRPARHDVGQHRLQRADRRHHDDPGDEAHRLPRLVCGCHRGVRLDRCRAGARR